MTTTEISSERLGQIIDGWRATREEAEAIATELRDRRAAGGEAVKATHRHKKRGTEYVLIGIGKMQAEGWERPTLAVNGSGLGAGGHTARVPADMSEVAIYRSATDPTEIWVRPREEFEDGRFEALHPSPNTGKSQACVSETAKSDTQAGLPIVDETQGEVVITDDMVERASRAICLAQGYEESELDDIGRISHLPLWQDKLGAARAALTAALKGGPDAEA